MCRACAFLLVFCFLFISLRWTCLYTQSSFEFVCNPPPPIPSPSLADYFHILGWCWLFSCRFVDALGICCGTQLDAQGLCCSSASGLDACGVCGGSGLTCAWEVTIFARGSDVRLWPDSIDIRDSEELELEEWDPNRLELVKRWNNWLSYALKIPYSSRVRLISANDSVIFHNESALCQKKKRLLCETERSENVPFCDLKESTLCSESEAISPVPYLAQHLDAGLLHTFCDDEKYSFDPLANMYERHCGEYLWSTDGMQTFTFKIQPQALTLTLTLTSTLTLTLTLPLTLTLTLTLTPRIPQNRSRWTGRTPFIHPPPKPSLHKRFDIG
jgi:hypothetical protein